MTRFVNKEHVYVRSKHKHGSGNDNLRSLFYGTASFCLHWITDGYETVNGEGDLYSDHQAGYPAFSV
jgi:hypothetical protein